MDTALLRTDEFWTDQQPIASGVFPGKIPPFSALAGQVLFETSGSTGAPKWLSLPKSGLIVSAAAVNHILQVSKKSCWGLALPLHHVGGFGVVARTYVSKCRFQEFSQHWNPQDFCMWLLHHSVTHTSLVPTQVHDLVAADLVAPKSLVAIVVGGGRLDPIIGQAARHLGWPVLASYGMTEAGSQIATQGMGQLKSLYQPAPLPILPIWQTRISENGQLSIAGPALFTGTLHRIEGHWTFNQRQEPWHLTSDRVDLSDSQLTPLGRMDAAVKVLGELVDPVVIEEELLALANGTLPPGSFAISTLPDKRTGHCLVPVFEASIDPAIAADALDLYQRKAPGFRRLLPPIFVESLPRSPLGKLRRTELAATVASIAGA